MVQFYVTMIRLDSITLDQVPARWRAAVAAAMEGGGQNG